MPPVWWQTDPGESAIDIEEFHQQAKSTKLWGWGSLILPMEVAIEFKLPMRVQKKGKWFVSSCPALDVFSQGRTRAEAEQNLADALYSFLISCYEAETLEKVLHEAGFVRSIGGHRAYPPGATSCVSVTLPLRIKASINRAVAH